MRFTSPTIENQIREDFININLPKNLLTVENRDAMIRPGDPNPHYRLNSTGYLQRW
jgi:hypothetical protein